MKTFVHSFFLSFVAIMFCFGPSALQAHSTEKFLVEKDLRMEGDSLKECKLCDEIDQAVKIRDSIQNSIQNSTFDVPPLPDSEPVIQPTKSVDPVALQKTGILRQSRLPEHGVKRSSGISYFKPGNVRMVYSKVTRSSKYASFGHRRKSRRIERCRF